MQDAWAIWQKTRHGSVHSILNPNIRKTPLGHYTAAGRIAGAINVLILKLIGYSGIVCSSVFEEKFHKI